VLQGRHRRAGRRGHDTLWLGVWEHNHAAQRFYARSGSRQVGVVRFVLDSDVQTERITSRPVALPDRGSPR
jgi:diamine N-acetyltransferase